MIENCATADVFYNFETGTREVFYRKDDPKMSEMVAADELRLLIERIERLEEEKKGISDDIREVYSEAKNRGYDAKIMRQIIKLRAMETHERQEWEAVLDTYIAALGM